MVLVLGFFLAGSGCLVDNEDDGPAKKAGVLEIPYLFDLDEGGRPDFRINGSYESSDGDMPAVMYLIFYNPGFQHSEGNATVQKRKLVEDNGDTKWEYAPNVISEQGVPIGPETAGLPEDPAIPSERKFYWDSHAGLCSRNDIAVEENCSGAFAGRTGYLGLRLGRGDTARYGWALLEVDTTRKDRHRLPIVVLHDYAVRSKPGVPLETGKHP